MYPETRLRRNRKDSWLRELVAETTLQPANLILPVFVIEGVNLREEIITMPGVHRLSIDYLVAVAKECVEYGIKAICIFPVVDSKLKTFDAKEAYNPNNLSCRAVAAIKEAKLDIGIICDVALDPYTSHSHDGLIVNDVVDNDLTIEILCKQALVLAQAGADIVAPSDMMDGRVMKIREALDIANFANIGILSYAAKYASSFYSPFRDAINTKKSGSYLSKSTYQMDIRNTKEAIREIEQDIQEGADIVMVKPALPYLDIISIATRSFDVNIFAYQVSGEYSMIKFASIAGALDFEASILESLISIKRSGASAILTYAALEVAKILNTKK